MARVSSNNNAYGCICTLRCNHRATGCLPTRLPNCQETCYANSQIRTCSRHFLTAISLYHFRITFPYFNMYFIKINRQSYHKCHMIISSVIHHDFFFILTNAMHSWHNQTPETVCLGYCDIKLLISGILHVYCINESLNVQGKLEKIDSIGTIHNTQFGSWCIMTRVFSYDVFFLIHCCTDRKLNLNYVPLHKSVANLWGNPFQNKNMSLKSFIVHKICLRGSKRLCSVCQVSVFTSFGIMKWLCLFGEIRCRSKLCHNTVVVSC